MKLQPQEKILLLGASSGLGKATFELLKDHALCPELLSFSRKNGGMDFSKKELWAQYVNEILNVQSPSRIIYFAAGGPYGDYKKFQWKDHEWSLNVSFSFPAFLLHSALQVDDHSQLKQILFIGSAVAETKPDPKASMYCAAKHALKGLISSVQLEEPKIDVQLFSPGYMDTPMLPMNSWPRNAGLAQKVNLVAQNLVEFMIR